MVGVEGNKTFYP